MVGRDRVAGSRLKVLCSIHVVVNASKGGIIITTLNILNKISRRIFMNLSISIIIITFIYILDHYIIDFVDLI